MSKSTRLLDGRSEHSIDLALEAFQHSFTRQCSKVASLSLLDYSLDLSLLFFEATPYKLHRLRLGDDVLYSNAEAIAHEPVVHHVLGVRQEELTRLGAKVSPHNMY